MGLTQPVLTEIDLSKTTKDGGGGLEVGPTYFVMVDGHMHTGWFSKQWYGLNFQGGPWGAGLQYDPPGTNGSMWERVWRLGFEEPRPKVTIDVEDQSHMLAGLHLLLSHWHDAKDLPRQIAVHALIRKLKGLKP